jgi:general secretion pathway protein E
MTKIFDRISLEEFRPLPCGENQYSFEFVERNSVLKLKETEERVEVGVCSGCAISLVEYLRCFHAKQVQFHLIDHSELAIYLGEQLAAAEYSAAEARTEEEEMLLLDRLANDAPVINLVNAILIEGIRAGASDIHVESFPGHPVVRYRVDGSLIAGRGLPSGLFPAVSSRIKIMANMNIMERRLPQEGRLTVHLDERSVDLRASIVPISGGESIVLRLFGAQNAPRRVEELGLSGGSLALLRSFTGRTRGLILATGPTGSGKSTTLKAMLTEIDAQSKKIVTIEDPIEYLLPGVAQIQTNEAVGLGFDMILRRVLRQDPDVIMVGEIRDRETAELAVRAALTGRLVYSTLHTPDSVSAVTRLRDIGIEPYLIAAVLRAVVAQRLVRRLCRACVREIPVSAAQARLLAQYGVTADRVHAAGGCAACRGTGYRGRVALVELFAVDDRSAAMIAEARPASEIRSRAFGQVARPLLEDGLLKAADGVTSMEEVARAVALE